MAYAPALDLTTSLRGDFVFSDFGEGGRVPPLLRCTAILILPEGGGGGLCATTAEVTRAPGVWAFQRRRNICVHIMKHRGVSN